MTEGGGNRERNLVCCRLCGRDTRAGDRICRRCTDGFQHSEQKGRSARAITPGYDPFDPPDEGDPYHGETVRDDV